MAKVTAPFRDRETWRAYAVGDEYDGTPERIQELSDGGYVDSGLIAHEAENSVSESLSVAHDGKLDELTVAQLRKLADERGVEVPKRASRDRLLEALGA